MRSTIAARTAGVLITVAMLALLPGCGGESERDLLASAKSYLEKKELQNLNIQEREYYYKRN